MMMIFEFDLDIIKKNILTKFQNAEAKIAASKVLTRFPLNFLSDLLFDPTDLTYISSRQTF